jgi:hypothetical protein
VRDGTWCVQNTYRRRIEGGELQNRRTSIVTLFLQDTRSRTSTVDMFLQDVRSRTSIVTFFSRSEE